MGNGLLTFNSLCCPNRYSKIEDIDINKNNYKENTIQMARKELTQINKNGMDDVKLKKIKTHRFSMENENKKKLNYRKEDSISYRAPNISLYNNTFQILNNTQQYISFSNVGGGLKNNLANNQLLRSIYNSKINSSIINLSRINSNLDDFIDINIKLVITGDLFLNKVIEINKFGMKNGLRKKKDGIAIFGCKEDNNDSDNNIPSLYDYFIDLNLLKKQKKGNRKKNHKGQIFFIFLDKKEKVFALNFVHSSLLLYYKINENLTFELDKDYFIILGDILLTITVKRSNNSNGKMLIILVETEDDRPKKYTFEQKEMPIKIGRDNCNINIPKSSISKLHSIIDFSNDNFLYKDAKSTNGSTLLIKEDDILKIKGVMNFKLEDISFKIKEIAIDEK